MDMMALLVQVLIAAPLVFGLLIFLLRAPRLRQTLTILAGAVTASAAVALAILAARGGYLSGGEPFRVFAPGWLNMVPAIAEPVIILVVLAIALKIRSVSIGILGLVQIGLVIAEHVIGGSAHGGEPVADFLLDPLSLILVLVVSVVGSVIVIYALGYMREHEHHAPPSAANTYRFFFVLVGFLGLMNGLVLANGVQWLSVFWELTTLCSFALIGHDGTEQAKASAKRALMLNSFGGAAMLGGTVLAAGWFGTHSLSGLMAVTAAKGAMIPMSLLCIAGLTKSAQMPFQSWLLGAMVAPTPVSALLHSATMVKAGCYLVLRLAPAFADTHLSYILAIAGAFTFAATSALAVGQSNAKKVLAYSTIGNLGLIITCAGINTPLAYSAALFILVFHAASKGLLFLCVGTIEQRIGSRDIEDMGRIMYLMPATTMIALAGMVSMLLAPFGMLIGKWLAIEAAIRSPLVLVLIIAGSALSVVFWAKWIGRIQTVSYHKDYKYEGLSPSMIIGMLMLVVPVLGAGMVTLPLYRYVVKPLAMLAYPHASAAAVAAAGQIDLVAGWPFYLFLGLAAMASWTVVRKIKSSSIRQPFMCGENVTGVARTYMFRSLMDKEETAWSGTYYFKGAFDEPRLTFWCNLVGGLIVITMLGALGAI